MEIIAEMAWKKSLPGKSLGFFVLQSLGYKAMLVDFFSPVPL